jgi:hypothetical protein
MATPHIETKLTTDVNSNTLTKKEVKKKKKKLKIETSIRKIKEQKYRKQSKY